MSKLKNHTGHSKSGQTDVWVIAVRRVETAVVRNYTDFLHKRSIKSLMPFRLWYFFILHHRFVCAGQKLAPSIDHEKTFSYRVLAAALSNVLSR